MPASRSHFHLRALALVVLVILATASVGRAQVFEKLFSFTDARAEDLLNSQNRGKNPYSALVQGNDGNLYGVTRYGGAFGSGTVFRMNSNGTLMTLVDFTNNGTTNKGYSPLGGLIQARDGHFYGTTQGGGAFSYGTVFKMTAAGALTTLVEFTGNGASNIGYLVSAGLVQGNDGNFYGATQKGGASDKGTLFKMTPSGQLTTLVQFTGNGVSNKGSEPTTSLVQASDGSFYGTTSAGGAGNAGTVFKMTSAGALTTLVEFTNNGITNKGLSPNALMQASDGNFYGTTAGGGGNGYGTVFRMTTAGLLTTLVEFTGNGTNNKGNAPAASLVQGNDGDLYGTTSRGGSSDYGTVFKMTLTGILTTLVNIAGSATTNFGNGPRSALLQGSDGHFYGTSVDGGASGYGTVFKMTSSGVFTLPVQFTGTGTNKGSQPRSALTRHSDGNFYGTTAGGGVNGSGGIVYKMLPSGQLTTVMEFTGTGGNGINPNTALVQGADESLYGTAVFGGVNNNGTIFKVTPGGVQTTLVQFTNNGATNKGRTSYAPLVLGSDGNFYGATVMGGASDNGTVFKMTPAGTLTTLVEFTGNGASNKGRFSKAALLRGSDGNFYGTTENGGASDNGTVFKMTPAGTLTTLVEFTGNGASNKGRNPIASLSQGIDGNLYGTTSLGGASDLGTVFKMTTGGILTTLAEFTGNGASNKGSRPAAGLLLWSDGNFYGTTKDGGMSGFGTVFTISPIGILNTVLEFSASNEGLPTAELISGADGNIYGTTTGPDGSIYRLVFPGTPLVGASDPAAVTKNTAVVQAKINARGFETSVWLDYSADGLIFSNTVSVATNLTGFQSKLVGTTLDALMPATAYYYRFRAISSMGTTVGPVAGFSTLAEPIVTTVAASQITPTSARFNGIVNARNYEATVRFEWGTDGNSFPNTATSVPATVTGNIAVTVSSAVAGLTKGTTYYYRIVATNAAGSVVSGTQTFRTLTEPTASIGGNFALSTTSVRVEGSVNAQGSDSSVVFEYGTDGVSFPNSVAATPSSVTGSSSTPVSATLTTLSQGATYHYRIKATSAGGVGTSASASFSMNVLSGFTQVFPSAPQAAEGFLSVTLAPSGLLHGWRFIGEQQWRASGVPVGGLTTGDREIEFRPVPGYIQPPQETLSVISGEAATVLARDYFVTATTGSGGLSVTLKPDSILSGSGRAQWRLLGENDTQWRDSGSTLTGLIPGSYLVECKAVTGRATPPPANVIVSNAQTALPTITYFLPDSPTGTPPSVLAFETVSTDTTKPYAHVGQIRSNVGSSSGFVVKARVVATAGHVVWDDGTLSAAQGLQWLFQRHRGTYEPKPITPRGFYLFDGYAAQRTLDNSPGDSSPQSQHLDVAAMYFNEDAGRGGYGGFLASDLAQNEFLISSAQKILVGYPVDGIAVTSQGRMHATAPANVLFTAAFGRTFTTTGIRSSGGNSGGPLCVQFEGGAYYPAAIYLGGDNQTVVRAIDSSVIDLFNRAEVSGNGGGNQTGGGITHTSVSTFGSAANPGAIKVLIEPAGARSAGAGWRLSPETGYRISGATKSGLNAGNYILQLPTVAGYDAPASPSVVVTGGQLATVIFTYGSTATPQESWRQTHFGSTANSGNAADAFDYDKDGLSNLIEWACNLNPTSASALPASLNSTGANLDFNYSRSVAALNAGVVFTVEWSDTLAGNDWHTAGVTQVVQSDNGTVQQVKATLPAGSTGQRFVRLKVTGAL